jgi:hypothetical protein
VWVEAFFSDDDICRRCCLELQLWRWLFVQGVGFVGVYLPSSCLRNVVGALVFHVLVLFHGLLLVAGFVSWVL